MEHECPPYQKGSLSPAVTTLSTLSMLITVGKKGVPTDRAEKMRMNTN